MKFMTESNPDTRVAHVIDQDERVLVRRGVTRRRVINFSARSVPQYHEAVRRMAREQGCSVIIRVKAQ